MNKIKEIAIEILIFSIIIITLIPTIIYAEETETIDSSEVFNDSSYFCVEIGQELSGSHTYTVKKTLTYDNGDNKAFLKGLAYILSYDKYNKITRTRRAVYSESHVYIGISSSEDPIQLALWRYIKEHESEAKSAFGFANLDPDSDKLIEETEKGIKYLKRKCAVRYKNGQAVVPEDRIEYARSSIAYTIYTEAESARNNEIDWEFEIKCLENSDYQNLIKLNSIERKESAHIKLTINKKDSLTGDSISGAKFNITIENVASIKGENGIPNGKTILQNRDAGQIVLENIKAKDANSDITITIEETKAPDNYRKAGNKTIVLERDGLNWKIKSGSGEMNNNSLSIDIYNQPLIKLSGTVWQDVQTGVKDGKVPDGIKNDGEERIPGVLVRLYYAEPKKDENNNEVKDSKGKTVYVMGKAVSGFEVETDKNGYYEFKDVPKRAAGTGYIVAFSYDGINYQATTDHSAYYKELPKRGVDGEPLYSDAWEDTYNIEPKQRENFNAKFKTIEQGQANPSNTKLSYTYGKKEATLNVKMNGTNPANSNEEDFRMNAYTHMHNHSTEDLDFGLVKKELDLALGTDVKEATVTINGVSQKYNYGQLMNGEWNFQNKSSDVQNINYNTYVTKSDYNYRIDDYKMENEAIENKVNSEDNKVNIKEIKESTELEVYVTYVVALINQTPSYEATINKFVYYYDPIYKPYNISSTDKYTVSINENERKITIESNGDGLKTTDRINIELTFIINKESDEYKNLINNSYEAKNIAEITKYSTAVGGLIDMDSAPGNANVTFENGTHKIGRYEDDTDEAQGLTISIPENKTRTIKGTVFEDLNKDAKNNDNKVVNDVVVQLIELVPSIAGDGSYYEYIWQETRSGSNQVKTTDRNGYPGKGYTNTVASRSGQYEFMNFIPSKRYIVRFVYGDGTYYDVTDNVKTYNGQDYKSTIDKSYKEEWYNPNNYGNNNGDSVARDNEARRLEIMAFTTNIDGGLGTVLNVFTEKKEFNNLSDEEIKLVNKFYKSLKDTGNANEINYIFEGDITKEHKFKEKIDAEEYNKLIKYISYKTWMCAETSKIDIKVDSNTTPNPDTTISYTNMNFGLAKRPETKLALEKHITALKITPNGTGVQPIVDASANIENIVNGTNVDAQGVTTGLATIKSTRSERGFWQVATDVEELTQGAELEVEYTYVIRNDGEKDYLSKFLVGEYEKGDGNYKETLSSKATEIKEATKGKTNTYGSYLGEFYYTGEKGIKDEEVTTRVETIEEALNNKLKFDDITVVGDFKKTAENVEKNVFDTNGNISKETIETVVQNTSSTKFLKAKGLAEKHTADTADYTKTIRLSKVLSSTSGGELGANIPSYITEIVKYSNAAGRRDMNAEPENLSYVHSDDSKKTMENSNENDEFWGETIIITKPTGEDKLTTVQIAIVTIIAIATLGVGIVLIKKFALKK